MRAIKTIIVISFISVIIGCKSVIPTLNPETQFKAENGDANSQLEIGRWHFNKGNLAEASIWFEKSAKQGNSIATYYLSQWFKEKGYKCLIDCLKQASHLGSSDAQYRLGSSYLSDLHETPKDLALAFKWIVLSQEGENSHYSGKIGVFNLINTYKISHLDISKGQKLAKEHFKKYGKSKCIYY
jgi:TPR repeat protein